MYLLLQCRDSHGRDCMVVLNLHVQSELITSFNQMHCYFTIRFLCNLTGMTCDYQSYPKTN